MKYSANKTSTALLDKLDELNHDETRRLSPNACFSVSAFRRKNEELKGHRQNFALDADRILHSRAYTRYIDKTQVFCLVSNDHITHRVLHVQLVSRVARTIARFLHLNEDLIEAIALGHDIGHPPFGHDGEYILSELCETAGLSPFRHNIQSVRFLDRLEKKGKGWNLAIQTLDGILCHDGEIHNNRLIPATEHSISHFEDKLLKKEQDPKHSLFPMTLEGCVVRLADTVSYIGRDIEDALILNLIERTDLPKDCVEVLGNTNGSIVYNLVTDIITHSHVTAPGKRSNKKNYIGFSNEVSEALQKLKRFNYEHIYFNPKIKKDLPLIKDCYAQLFTFYLKHIENENKKERLQVDLMSNMDQEYLTTHSPAAKVRDFMAGMTDKFFISQARNIGCKIPLKQ